MEEFTNRLDVQKNVYVVERRGVVICETSESTYADMICDTMNGENSDHLEEIRDFEAEMEMLEKENEKLNEKLEDLKRIIREIRSLVL